MHNVIMIIFTIIFLTGLTMLTVFQVALAVSTQRGNFARGGQRRALPTVSSIVKTTPMTTLLTPIVFLSVTAKLM